MARCAPRSRGCCRATSRGLSRARRKKLRRAGASSKPNTSARYAQRDLLAAARLAAEYRLRCITHSLDRVIGVEETDDPARAAFEPFIAPREGADQAALA